MYLSTEDSLICFMKLNIIMKSKCDKKNARKEDYRPMLFMKIDEKTPNETAAGQF